MHYVVPPTPDMGHSLESGPQTDSYDTDESSQHSMMSFDSLARPQRDLPLLEIRPQNSPEFTSTCQPDPVHTDVSSHHSRPPSSTRVRPQAARQLRPRRIAKMPLLSSTHRAPVHSRPAASQRERCVIAPLKTPVPAFKLHENNTSLQISDAVKAIERLTTSQLAATNDDSVGNRQTDYSMMFQSSQETVDPPSDESNLSGTEDTSGSQRVDVVKKRDRELELFLTVAGDWQVLDPSMLTSVYKKPKQERSRAASRQDLDDTIALFQRMLTTQHSVANFMVAEVGSLLAERVAQDKDYLKQLASRAADLKRHRYHQLLGQCNCNKCAESVEWELQLQQVVGRQVPRHEAARFAEAQRPVPCPTSQFRIEHINSDFSGLSETNLKRAVTFGQVAVPGEGITVVTAPSSKVVTCSGILKHGKDA